MKSEDQDKYFVSHPKLFTASHLVGCPHKVLWKGNVVQLGLTDNTLIRKFCFSGMAYECPEFIRSEFDMPDYKYLQPPPKFWSSMPDELVILQFDYLGLNSDDMYTVFSNTLSSYMFLMDVGAFPDIFFCGLEPNTESEKNGAAFLFQVDD